MRIIMTTPPPKWWRPQYGEPDFAALDAKILEMERMVKQYPPGRRQTASSRLSAAAIFRMRAAQAALPPARARICESRCYEKSQEREACDSIMCRALVQ